MIIDVIDAADLGRRWKGKSRKFREELREEKQDLRSWIKGVKEAGGDPIVVYGMSNALAFVVDEVIGRAGLYGSIELLRFHGHGAPGLMGIAGGKWSEMSRHVSDFGPRRRRLAGRTLAELGPYFAPHGRIELHGCEVAKGHDGRGLIRWIANAVGVPVSAAVRSQFDSGWGPDTYRFEGPVLTARPDGRIIRTSWKNVPGAYCGF